MKFRAFRRTSRRMKTTAVVFISLLGVLYDFLQVCNISQPLVMEREQSCTKPLKSHLGLFQLGPLLIWTFAHKT